MQLIVRLMLMLKYFLVAGLVLIKVY